MKAAIRPIQPRSAVRSTSKARPTSTERSRNQIAATEIAAPTTARIRLERYLTRSGRGRDLVSRPGRQLRGAPQPRPVKQKAEHDPERREAVDDAPPEVDRARFFEVAG